MYYHWFFRKKFDLYINVKSVILLYLSLYTLELVKSDNGVFRNFIFCWFKGSGELHFMICIDITLGMSQLSVCLLSLLTIHILINSWVVLLKNNFGVLKKTLKFLNVIVIYMNPIHTCSSDTLYQYTVKPVLCDLSRENWYTVCSHNIR
jgi:hypothetical protein